MFVLAAEPHVPALLHLAAGAVDTVSKSELQDALSKQAARFELLLDAQAAKLERLEEEVCRAAGPAPCTTRV